jgi:hypothetical protein
MTELPLLQRKATTNQQNHQNELCKTVKTSCIVGLLVTCTINIFTKRKLQNMLPGGKPTVNIFIRTK